MGVLNQEIKEFVKQTKLGFVATVCPDGTPNLSPKGTPQFGTTIILFLLTFIHREQSLISLLIPLLKLIS
jgi:predicted pyridoxine 5'-phosphate oxidase superfamily flavin-nucleotide-binding protein